MSKILVVVESPNKITKLTSILGSGYKVVATSGIFRDLDPKPKKGISVDMEHNFEPQYIYTKPEIKKALISSFKGMDMLYIASDMDLEGDGIAKSVYDTLKPEKYKRLVFNSITKSAIMESIKKAGKIDENRVNAQKARRVIDRIYGYLVSDIIRKKIGGSRSMSAGRVLSVVCRLIIDREREIEKFINDNTTSTYYKITGIFSGLKAVLFNGTFVKDSLHKGSQTKMMLDKKGTSGPITTFLKVCLKSKFKIHHIQNKDSNRSPSAPFTTSTLQQEASRKLGMSIDTTMFVAQKLYEAGLITYMRTDSVDISEEGHKDIKETIISTFGKKMYKRNVYKNKNASSQEAHEAIRPVKTEVIDISDKFDQKQYQKLYKLIWSRTIASQMVDAVIDIQKIHINISKYIDNEPFYYFECKHETVKFPGFMSVYVESNDDEDEKDNEKNKKIKTPKSGSEVIMENIKAEQQFPLPPHRYTSASIIKKMEEVGIGRPSTYAPSIKKVLDNGYAEIDDVEGITKKIDNFEIKSKNGEHIMEVKHNEAEIIIASDKNKLVPTKVGITVNDFLMKYFPTMMDYKFTAQIEKDLDEICTGKKIWHKVVKYSYDKLSPELEKTNKLESLRAASERVIGKDKDGYEYIAYVNSKGPVVAKRKDNKIISFEDIKKPLTTDTIKMKDISKMFEFPKTLGNHKNKEIVLYKSRDKFAKKGTNYFFKYDGKNYAISNDTKIKTFDLNSAIEIINSISNKIIKTIKIKHKNKKSEIEIINGQYGYYFRYNKRNISIPKDINIDNIDEEKIIELIEKPVYKKTYRKAGSKQ
jgi:DNA topoisomerase-1